MDSLSETLKLITAALDQLHIRYFVGGSVASSVRGVWRATLDVDLVAAIRPDQTASLVDALGPEWYADPDMIQRSIQHGRPFNLIHTRTVMKVDIFPAIEDFHRSQLERATTLPLGLGQIPCSVATAEDSLLAKLRWYKDGGEVSDQQWRDVLTLCRNTRTFDLDYLHLWAARLGVTSLLEKAQSDAQLL
jgi:hypothetical protein